MKVCWMIKLKPKMKFIRDDGEIIQLVRKMDIAVPSWEILILNLTYTKPFSLYEIYILEIYKPILTNYQQIWNKLTF